MGWGAGRERGYAARYVRIPRGCSSPCSQARPARRVSSTHTRDLVEMAPAVPDPTAPEPSQRLVGREYRASLLRALGLQHWRCANAPDLFVISAGSVALLAGGVGGAKLAHGLQA